jgi:glycosyltransferase involved in cell wall biosynthesis
MQTKNSENNVPLSVSNNCLVAGSLEASNEKKRALVFIFGMQPDEETFPFIALSRKTVWFAADALQRSILKGVVECGRLNYSVVNLPFVGSYPFFFRKFYFPKVIFEAENRLVHGVGFLNLPILRLPSRFLACMFALIRQNDKQPKSIVVYSVHLPFLLSGILQKLIAPNQKLILIILDFPELMADGNLVYRLAKTIEKWSFRGLLNFVDGLVLVSKHMKVELGLNENFPSIVLEGVYNEEALLDLDTPSGLRRYILYAGTLDRRYGLNDLLSAFELLSDPGLELWICGGGDMRVSVLAAAKTNPRIKYLGMLPRKEVQRLQRSAIAIVNPRRPDGQFTKMSFPSKTIEYLASGRPTVFHMLEGIPEEYANYAIVPKSPDVDGLAEAINRVLEMTQADQRELGSRAREFILNHKSAKHQAKKLLQFIDSI